ncbi:MAG: hypothetical protein LBT48_00895 [Prevotellaceae bacterium]|nr:hypothetical protein [Prevotellaceae bacterium]
MKQNKLFFCAASLIAGLALVSACSGDDPVEPAKLKVSPATITTTADGGASTITVDANVEWTAVSDELSWVGITGETKTSFVINVTASTVTEPRTATVTVSGGGLTESITVTQDAFVVGTTVLSVSPESADVAAAGGTSEFTVTSNADAWTAESNQTWAKVSPASGANNGKITVTSEANDGDARTATITVKAGDNTKTVTVKQAKTAGVETTLDVTPASAKVVEVSATADFVVTSNSNWTAESSETWAVVSPASGASNGTITVTTEANDGAERSATITVKADDKTKTVTVTQAAKGAYFKGITLPYTEEGVYSAKTVQGYPGDWSPSCGVLAYKVTLAEDGVLNVVDKKSPTHALWWLIYGSVEDAKTGEWGVVSGDGTASKFLTAGTYYIVGISNAGFGGYEDVTLDDEYNAEITFTPGSPYFKLSADDLPYSASGTIKDAETFYKYGMPWGTSDALVVEIKLAEETTLLITPSASLVPFIYDDATAGGWDWLLNADKPFEYTFEANKVYYLVHTIATDYDANSSYDLSIAVPPTLQTFVVPDDAAVGDTWNLKDSRDAQVYPVVKMADGKVWLAKNLNYTTGLTEGDGVYHCQEGRCDRWGVHYGWSTAQTVCPTGWHVPTEAEAHALQDALIEVYSVKEDAIAALALPNDPGAGFDYWGDDTGYNNATKFNGIGSGSMYGAGAPDHFPNLSRSWVNEGKFEFGFGGTYWAVEGFSPAEYFTVRCIKE